MRIEMNMSDYESSRSASIAQTDVEYLGDVAEVFLTFLHTCGYTYAEQVIVVKSGGEEVATVR